MNRKQAGANCRIFDEGTDGEADYHAGDDQLSDGEADYHAGDDQLSDGEADYHAGDGQLSDGEADYHAGDGQLSDGEADYRAGNGVGMRANDYTNPSQHRSGEVFDALGKSDPMAADEDDGEREDVIRKSSVGRSGPSSASSAGQPY